MSKHFLEMNTDELRADALSLEAELAKLRADRDSLLAAAKLAMSQLDSELFSIATTMRTLLDAIEKAQAES